MYVCAYINKKCNAHTEKIRDTGWLKQGFRRGEHFDDQLKMAILEFFTTICHPSNISFFSQPTHEPAEDDDS